MDRVVDGDEGRGIEYDPLAEGFGCLGLVVLGVVVFGVLIGVFGR